MNPSCQVVAPVFQDYRNSLIRFIQSRVKDSVDSEELLSQVLLKVYDHCEKLEDVKSTEAWLIAIAKNTINDYFRSKQRQEIKGEMPDTIDLKEDSIYEELEACIPSLIDRLPDKYGVPLKAYELNGISQKSLAIQMGMSESGLKSRVQRGRKMLRELFTEYCGHLIQEEGCSDCKKC